MGTSHKGIDVKIDIDLNIDIPKKEIKNGESYLNSVAEYALSTFLSQETAFSSSPLPNPDSTLLPSPNPMDEPQIFVRSEQNMQQKVSRDGSPERSFISSTLNWLGNPFGLLPDMGFFRGAAALPMEQRWEVGVIESIPTLKVSSLENRTARVAAENTQSVMTEQNYGVYSNQLDPNVASYHLAPIQAVKPGPQGGPEAEMVCQPALFEETTPIVHCSQPHSDTLVFLKQSDSSALSPHINNKEPSSIAGDTYDLESCKPIDFYGNSAIQCEGEETILVDVPKPFVNSAESFFEGLNSALTLAPVAIHLAKGIYNCLMGETVKENENLETGEIATPEYVKIKIKALEELLSDIEKMLSTRKRMREFDMFRHILEDKIEDLAELKGKAVTFSTLQNMENDINDLKIEVVEALKPAAPKLLNNKKNRLKELEYMQDRVRKLARYVVAGDDNSSLQKILTFYDEKITSWKKRVDELCAQDIRDLWGDILKLQEMCTSQNPMPVENCHLSQKSCGFFNSANATGVKLDYSKKIIESAHKDNGLEKKSRPVVRARHPRLMQRYSKIAEDVCSPKLDVCKKL